MLLLVLLLQKVQNKVRVLILQSWHDNNNRSEGEALGDFPASEEASDGSVDRDQQATDERTSEGRRGGAISDVCVGRSNPRAKQTPPSIKVG